MKRPSSAQIEIIKTISELLLIILWAGWIGRAYLNMRADMWPSNGQEYIMSTQNQYNWAMLSKCGSCFFWNGFTNGGAPSFVDVHGVWLHPVGIATTFLLGVFNSGKGIVLVSLLMAGLAQWWLGKIFNLGRASRLWTALVMVGSGALAGRMQIGNVPLVLSTAACALVFPAALSLALRGTTRNMIVFGLVLGMALLSGQGYLQIGLIISLTPWMLSLLLKKTPTGTLQFDEKAKYFLYAIILALLIAAPLLVPVAHIAPIMNKDADPAFSSSQPMKYGILNLVINDPEYYQYEILSKLSFPYLYINYIGWLPVILALWGLAHLPSRFRNILVGLSLAIVLIYLTSSAELFKWMTIFSFGKFFASIRNPAPIQGLAVPLILLLSGLGLDHLLSHSLPQVGMVALQSKNNLLVVNLDVLKWLVVLVLLFTSLKSVSDFSENWLYVTRVPADITQDITVLKTPSAQWVQPPFGEYFWFPAAIRNGLKIREFFRPWSIIRPEMPRAYLEMSRVAEDANLPEYEKSVDGFVILRRVNNEYAYITQGENIFPCQASAQGGYIDVECNTSSAGTLTVVEKAFSGWNVTLDGKKVDLLSDGWLSVQAPAGRHKYSFRYQPWDAPLGMVLAVLGWVAALVGLFYKPKGMPVLPSSA